MSQDRKERYNMQIHGHRTSNIHYVSSFHTNRIETQIFVQKRNFEPSFLPSLTMPYECGDCCGEGFVACLYVTFCPCLAMKSAVELVGGPKDPAWAAKGALKNDDPSTLCWVDCCGRTLCLLQCGVCMTWCVLASVSEIVGDRVGIQDDHCCKAFPLCATCCCHYCAVYNKAVQYDRMKTNSPAEGEIERE